MTVPSRMLPAEFADLEPFAARWSLATEPERWAERRASSIETMRELYDAVLPRYEAVLAHCARDIVAREMTAVSLKEFALQDDSLIESIQATLGSAGLTEFPLGEQEILCRHLHQTAQEWVRAYQGELSSR